MEDEKPIKVKGVDTGAEPGATDGGGHDYTKIPRSKPADVYKAPKTAQEDFLQKIGNVASVSSGAAILGTDFTVDPRAAMLYTPVDLAAGIRDPNERAKFLNEHGSRMTKLMGQDQYGIRFNHEIKDYAAYKEKLYDKRVDKFLDDLDENQGFLAEVGNTATKLMGNTAVAVSSLIPLVYGLGKGLFTWDAQNIFNNGMFDAWETMDQGINNKFAVYGGSDYDIDENGEQKGFFSRFVSHPMKSLNADIAPAVSFIAGAIITEMLAVPLGAMTGGTALVANTARLGAQATKLFARGASELGTLGIKGTNLLLPKGMKVLRGLETLTDYQKAKQVAVLSQKYRATLGTATSMIRSAGYESSLIARDTYDSTLESLLAKHEELNGEPPTEAEMALYKQKAGDASEYAWFTNIPLVGFSNMIQFPKIFAGGYKVNQALSRLSPLKSTGTVINKAGQREARSEVLGKWGRTAAVGGAMVKSGVTEGFEEFSQGVLEHGLADYYTAKYTKNSRETSIGLLSAMNTAARNYAGSTEGQDSMAIGFLMGMVGLRLPMRVNKETGKLERGWAAYGGAREARKELKEKWAKDAVNAEHLNTNSTQDALKANYDNMARGVTTQEDQDAALAAGDKYGFKNSEHSSMHSFVSTRIQLGLEDTIFQDLDAFQELPLANFNDQFATKGVKDFTEETRKESLDKIRHETKNVIKATKEVNALFNDTKVLVDFLRKDYKGLQDPKNITGALKEQMIYLHSANKNFSEREKSLQSEVQDLTDGKINPTVFRNIIGRITGVRKDDGSAEMITSAKELYKAAMQDWKSKDPDGYNQHSKEVAPILQDLVKIKVKKAQLSTMYNMLFTKSGAEKFAEFYELLEEHYVGEAHKQVLEQIANAAKNAKTADRTTKAGMDEKSITGDTPIVNAQTKREADLADAEVSAMINQNSPQDASQVADLSSLIPLVSPTEILKILEGKPGLFAQIRKSLLDKGIVIGDTVSEVRENLVEDPKIGPAIVAEFAKLIAANSSEESVKDQSLDFADERDASQPNPVPQDELTLEQQLQQSLNKLERTFTPGQQVNPTAIIGVTHDKEIKGGKLNRDPATGRFIKRDTAQKADTALLNSPEFLSNAELKAEFKYVQFKLEETIPWKDKEGNTVEITEANTRIGAYHNGIFLMDLPAFTAGMPLNFLALRKAIIAQETKVAEETTPVSTDTKADIKRQELLEKNVQDLKDKRNALRGSDGVVPKENMAEWTQLGKDVIEAQNKATRGNNKGFIPIRTEKDGVLTGEDAIKAENEIERIIQKIIKGEITTDQAISFIQNKYRLLADENFFLLNYINDRTSNAPEIGNNKQSFSAWRQGKYDAELAALGTDTKANIETKKAELKEKLRLFKTPAQIFQKSRQELYNTWLPIAIQDTGLSETELIEKIDKKGILKNAQKEYSAGNKLSNVEQFAIYLNTTRASVEEVRKELEEYNKIKAEIAALEGSSTGVSNIVTVYHHTNVNPQDFNFSDLQRGKDQISQFGDGLNAASTTTPFFVKRYGNPIKGEVKDSDFIVIDANMSQKAMYDMLVAKGFKFNNPQMGKATPQGGAYVGGSPETEYDDTNSLKDSPGAAMSLFKDFQDSNPDVKGVKVINHIIGNENVDPFYVIYDAKSFYGPDTLSKSSATPISEREALIAQYLKTIAEQAEIKTQGCK
jgi:hypothetical protein